MIAKTLSGLEDLLADELRELGAEDVRVMGRSVEFRGDQHTLYKTNFCSRLATRILKPVANFHAANGEQLYDHISRIDWSSFMDRSTTFTIDPVVHYSDFTNTHFVALKAKDAIVDQLRSPKGERPSIEREHPDLRINIHIHQNKASVSLDSSGDPLHKRGYRTTAGKAPLSEICAAGIIGLTGWNGDCSLIDGMCGSGTLIIEAAMKARRIAPGLIRRDFGFMRWKDYDKKLYDSVFKKARRAMLPDLSVELVGSDISGNRVKEAVMNARRAGVAEDIRFRHKPFEEQNAPPSPGVLVMNPPYGERLQIEHLNELYASIGDRLKQHYEGFDAYVFTGSSEAAKSIGLRASRRIKLFNGPIECRLLKFEIYSGSRKDHSENPKTRD